MLCRPGLATVFSNTWINAHGSLEPAAGLDNVLLTCQDYIEEVVACAVLPVIGMFQKCLLRHLVCCMTARMLSSACKYDAAWQRGAALEERRLRRFIRTHLNDIAATGEAYLAMLSMVRALLCAPDVYTFVTAYAEVRVLACIAQRACCHANSCV